MWGLKKAVIFTIIKNLAKKGRNEQEIETNFKKLAILVQIHGESQFCPSKYKSARRGMEKGLTDLVLHLCVESALRIRTQGQSISNFSNHV